MEGTTVGAQEFASAVVVAGGKVSARAGFVPVRAGVLTPRQTDVLGLVAHGLSADEIGAELGISAHTAKEHTKACCSRLGARNRTHAVAIALQKKLIRP